MNIQKFDRCLNILRRWGDLCITTYTPVCYQVNSWYLKIYFKKLYDFSFYILSRKIQLKKKDFKKICLVILIKPRFGTMRTECFNSNQSINKSISQYFTQKLKQSFQKINHKINIQYINLQILNKKISRKRKVNSFYKINLTHPA